MSHITLPRAVVEEVVRFIDSPNTRPWPAGTQYRLSKALRAALDAALAEPEPVAWIVTDKDGKVRKFLTAPLGFGVSELVRFDGDTMSPLYAGDTVSLDYIKEDKT